MLSTRQMPQQAPSQQPPQAPPQGPPKVPPPVQHPPVIPQGPYPDLPPYFPYPLVAIQNRPSSFNNRRGDRPNNNKSKSGPNRNNKCLQCGGYGHWAKLSFPAKTNAAVVTPTRSSHSTLCLLMNTYLAPQYGPPPTAPPQLSESSQYKWAHKWKLNRIRLCCENR